MKTSRKLLHRGRQATYDQFQPFDGLLFSDCNVPVGKGVPSLDALFDAVARTWAIEARGRRLVEDMRPVSMI